jgi:hypothetical protein
MQGEELELWLKAIWGKLEQLPPEHSQETMLAIAGLFLTHSDPAALAEVRRELQALATGAADDVITLIDGHLAMREILAPEVVASA